MKDRLDKYSEVFIVCDSAVEEAADAIAGQASGVRSRMSLDISPEVKNIGTVLDICRFLAASGAGRDSLLLAVGGGTTSDIAGFAAAIYKRGIHFAIAPTTLLSMVDAAYGGKNGVNLDGFKNMLGTFLEPDFVHPLPETLATLPRREFLSGAAEMLKTFLVADAASYAEAVGILSGIHTGSDVCAALQPLILKAAEIKKTITARDPLDFGERHKLNLGHSYGHALEWYEQTGGVRDPHTHGEAVAIGIIMAAQVSEDRGIAQKGLAARLKDDFKRCGLPVELPVPAELLEPALAQDKKNEGGRVKLVLLEDIGKAVL